MLAAGLRGGQVGACVCELVCWGLSQGDKWLHVHACFHYHLHCVLYPCSVLLVFRRSFFRYWYEILDMVVILVSFVLTALYADNSIGSAARYGEPTNLLLVLT